jgi:hypothetical protein
MAKRSTRARSPVRVIEKSFSDAQKVLARYIASGSEQVTDTIRSLRRIFGNRELASALKKARAARMEVAEAVGGDARKTRKATSSRRGRKAKGRVPVVGMKRRTKRQGARRVAQ